MIIKQKHVKRSGNEGKEFHVAQPIVISEDEFELMMGLFTMYVITSLALAVTPSTLTTCKGLEQGSPFPHSVVMQQHRKTKFLHHVCPHITHSHAFNTNNLYSKGLEQGSPFPPFSKYHHHSKSLVGDNCPSWSSCSWIRVHVSRPQVRSEAQVSTTTTA